MSQTIKLSTPINVDGVLTDSLTMREPLVEDNLAAIAGNKSPAVFEVDLFATLCGVSPQDFRKMTGKDYKRVQDAYVKLTTDEEGTSAPLD